MTKTQFTFDISLSVLDHLGRNLYRSFATVLGEAISNAWDADASNVYIFIDRDRGCFLIKDDGVGMSEDDFQNKFLKIGYTKRKEGTQKSAEGPPLHREKRHWQVGASVLCQKNICCFQEGWRLLYRRLN